MSASQGHLLRELAPQVLGALVRRYRDFAAAEDAVQEALLAAAQQWPTQGVPNQPRSWLIRVAARRLTDQLRSRLAERRREHQELAEQSEQVVDPEVEPERDDTLLLLFMCCHPALSRTSAVALTLRAVGGLTTAEIASAFLVPEATMAQRISRAKQQLRHSGARLQQPSPSEASARLDAVLHVLYLVFNEGYATSEGQRLHRVDLSDEAIRLTRAVHQLQPDEAEVAGLLALMLLTDSRRPARSGPEGQLIPLDEQDRSLWSRDLIREGVELTSRALSRGAVGPYQLQAAIAACHAEARQVQDTDWSEILALYGLLERMTDNPMVTLNRAVAVAMLHGPAQALATLLPLDADPRLARHHRLAAVRAHLHQMSGNVEDAVRLYRQAADLTTSLPERNYLLMKAAALTSERA